MVRVRPRLLGHEGCGRLRPGSIFHRRGVVPVGAASQPSREPPRRPRTPPGHAGSGASWSSFLAITSPAEGLPRSRARTGVKTPGAIAGNGARLIPNGFTVLHHATGGQPPPQPPTDCLTPTHPSGPQSIPRRCRTGGAFVPETQTADRLNGIQTPHPGGPGRAKPSGPAGRPTRRGARS